MLNISPIGRNCNREERDAFETFDLVSQSVIICMYCMYTVCVSVAVLCLTCWV